jgi:hypothetical protein
VARLRVLVGAILAAALVLAFTAPAAAGSGGTAKVRAFHNSPDTPPATSTSTAPRPGRT